MGEGKNRLSVIVDDPAKENLLTFQKQHKLRTRDDSVETILHKVPEWEAQEARNKDLEAKVKILEARIKELEVEKS